MKPGTGERHSPKKTHDCKNVIGPDHLLPTVPRMYGGHDKSTTKDKNPKTEASAQQDRRREKNKSEPAVQEHELQLGEK